MKDIETITDGTSYRAWITDWKAEYAALTATIRATKHQMKDAARAGGENPYQWRRQKLRQEATYLLETRAFVKEQAHAERAQRFQKAA